MFVLKITLQEILQALLPLFKVQCYYLSVQDCFYPHILRIITLLNQGLSVNAIAWQQFGLITETAFVQYFNCILGTI